jgi:hypothetical protein
MKFRLIACLLLICGILIGGAPQAAGPAFIDATNLAFPNTGNSSSALLAKSGSNLYLFNTKTLPPSPLEGANSAVYKSTDNGTTWVESDSANYPIGVVGAAIYDSAGNQFITALCVVYNSADFPFQTPQPMYLKTFNLTTETWGADFASPGPVCSNISSVFQRPDSSIVVIYSPGSHLAGTTNLRAAVWNGATWSGSIDIGVALLPTVPSGYVYAHGSTMDSTGVVHIVFQNSSNLHWAYQQLLTNNTLGSSTIFTVYPASVDGLGNLTIQGNSIFIPFMRSNQYQNAILIGTPLSAPVWTESEPPALVPIAGAYGDLRGSIGSDGTALYWEIRSTTHAGFNNDYTTYQLATSCDNGATWAIVPSNLTNPYFYNFGPGGSPVDLDVVAGVEDDGAYISVLHSGGITTVYLFGQVANITSYDPEARSPFISYFMNYEVFSGTCNAPLVCCVACSFLGGKSSSY